MAHIFRIIIILSIFNSVYSVVAATLPDITESKADNILNVRPLILHEISTFLKRLGEGTFNFTDEERDVAYYSKDISDEKTEIRNIITLRVAAQKFFNNGNYLESLRKNINLFYKTRGQTYLCSMIDIARDTGLSDQAIDLYMLSALMLAKSPNPILPKQIPGRVFVDPSYRTFLTQLSMVRDSPRAIPEFWSAMPIFYFDVFPLLTRKVCLLFPDNEKKIELLGSMIHQQKLDLDENGEEIAPGQHEMVAARLYSKAGTETSRYNIARLVQSGKINTDENGTIFEEKDRNEIAARIYRTFAIPKHCNRITARKILSDTARQALSNLAGMIADGETDCDEYNEIIPIGKHKTVAAMLYLDSGLPMSMCNFAQMISKHEVDFNENNESISSELRRYNAKNKKRPISIESMYSMIKERVYRNYQTPQALNNLTIMIMKGETDRDEYNQIISEGMRNLVTARLYRKSGIPIAQINLALMIIRNETDHDLEGTFITDRFATIMKLACTNGGESNYVRGYAYSLFSDTANRKNALAEFEQALEKGFSPALPNYALLKKELEIEQKSALEAVAELTETVSNLHIGSDEGMTDSEEDDYEADDLDDESSVTLIASAPSAARAEAWRKTVSAQRKAKNKAKWQEKLRNASTQSISTLEKTTDIIELWEKEALKGRLKLVDVWDRRITDLIEAIKNKDDRLGAPKTLSGDYEGWMSRRISRKHRLVYKLDQNGIRIRECAGHYEEPIRQSSYVSIQ